MNKPNKTVIENNQMVCQRDKVGNEIVKVE